jgi:hypothetical protein
VNSGFSGKVGLQAHLCPAVDATLVQRRNGFDQVLERAARPIQAPDDKGIVFVQVEQRAAQYRPVGRRRRELLSQLLSTDSSSTAQVRIK